MTSRLFLGRRVHGLLEHGAGAAAIVLGDRTRTAIALPAGSVISGVAARAHCPVVVVPVTAPDPGPDAPVVVGVRDVDDSVELLREAVRVAGLSSRRLEVVRSSRLPAPYTDVLTQADENSWRRSFERVVSTVLEEVDVGPASGKVKLQTTDQAPAQALTSAPHGAAEVMVGRRGTGAPWVHHLGTVPRAVLAHASSPVRVVPMRVPDDGSIHLHVTDAEVAPAF